MDSFSYVSDVGGSTNLSKAVQGLKRRVAEAEAAKPAETQPKRQVDIVRKLDLLQRLNDANSSDFGEGKDGQLSLQDRVFHAMVLEKLPDFTSLAPSFMPKSEAKLKAAALTAPLESEHAEPVRDPKSWANRPGAKHTSKTGGLLGTSQKVKEIIVPLGPERMTSEEIMHTLKNEFAVRYCESLGIAPTGANVADINRRMPLSQCHIRQVIHPGLGRGERKNYIAIAPPCYKPMVLREARKKDVREDDIDARATIPFERLAASVQLSQGQTQQQGSSSQVVAQTLGIDGSPSAVVPQFEDYKMRFVRPFNLTSRFEGDPDKPIDEFGGLKATTTTGRHSPSAPAHVGPRPPQGTPSAGRNGTTAGSAGYGTLGLSTEAMLDAARAASFQQSFTSATEKRKTNAKLSALDNALARARQGQGLSLDDAQRLKHAVADERPMAVTEAHIHALEKLLGQPRDPDVGDDPSEHAQANSFASRTMPGTASYVNNMQATAQNNFSSSAAAAVVGAGGGAGMNETHRATVERHQDAVAQREVDNYSEPSGVGEIKLFQTLFVKDFPFGNYFDDKTEIAGIKVGLTSAVTGGFIAKMLRFMFLAYLAPRASTERNVVAPGDRDDAFVAFYEAALDVFYSPQAFGTELTSASAARLAPMILLELRVALDFELKKNVPALLRTPAGQQLAATMDGVLTAVVDPLNLLTHISVVDSSPHSMRVMQTKRRPGRVPPLMTSPLTHFVLGEPQAPSAKALARCQIPRLQRGLAELQKHLTPMARSRLLQTMAAKKFKLPAEMEGHLLDSAL